MTPSDDRQEQTMPAKQTPKKHRPWRLILIVTALFIGVFFTQQALQGWSKDQVNWRYSFNQASAESNETNKPLLVVFTADWCPPCKQMKAWVYSNKNVADAIEAGFIPVKVDLTTEGLPDQNVAERYEVQSIPTMLTLTPAGTPIGRSVGYLNKEDFLNWLDTSSMRYATLKEDMQAQGHSIAEVETTPAR
jgi:thiol:disulfide interchange protein